MFLTKLKIATAVLLAAALAGVGVGGLFYRTQAEPPLAKQQLPQATAIQTGPSKAQAAAIQDKRDKPLLGVPLPHRTMMTVALSANGKLLAVAPHDKTTVQLWDVTTGKEHTLKGNPFSVIALAFSSDSKTLATGTGSWLPDGAPGEIKLWDVATGEERATLGRLPEGILALAFSPDGKILASASSSVKLWDAPTAKEKSELKPNDGVWLSVTYGEVVHRLRGSCWSVAFSPDGKTLAVGVGVLEDDTPGAAILYDVGTGKVRATFPGHKGAVACVAFAPDGRTLASANSRGTLKLWDVATAKERANIRNTDGTFGTFLLQSLAFASDGKTVVSTMRLAPPMPGVVLKEWSVADGKERATYRGTAKAFPVVISGDATVVGLAGPELEAPLVETSGKLELWELRSLGKE